jgi:hypothetical protein
MTTDPTAVSLDELIPTCTACGATYGPPGRDYDPRVFGPWLDRHTHPEAPRANR